MKKLLITLCLSGLSISNIAHSAESDLKNNAKIILGHTVNADNITKSMFFADSFKNSLMQGLSIYNNPESSNIIFVGIDRIEFNLTSTVFKYKADVKIKRNEKNYEMSCNININLGFSDALTSWGRTEMAQRQAGEDCSKEISNYISNL